MLGEPQGLISALEKLGAYNRRIPSNIPQTTAALCIVKPLAGPGSGWGALFATHPPLEERIAALRQMNLRAGSPETRP
jgi:heat shock protein HtpX